VHLAIECVESLTPSTLAVVSLAELDSLEGRWADVVDLTDGTENEDELSTYLLIQRRVALREKRFFEASRESLKRALAIRSRPTALRRLALVERGQCYLAEGTRSIASQDFQKMLAENAAYPGLAAYQGERRIVIHILINDYVEDAAAWLTMDRIAMACAWSGLRIGRRQPGSSLPLRGLKDRGGYGGA